MKRLRVWSKSHKSFLNDKDLTLDLRSGLLWLSEDLVVQQSTELKDNFGTEIFEGDIVEVLRGDSLRNHLATIEFKLGSFGYMIPFKIFDEERFEEFVWYNPNGNTHTVCTRDMEGDWMEEREMGYIVIGNVFQTPELVGSTQKVETRIVNREKVEEEDYYD